VPKVLEMLKNRGNGPGRGQSSAPTSYRVRCLCGETVEGYRQTDYQTLTCPSCQGTILVLGESPLLSPDPPQAAVTKASSGSSSARRFVRRRSLRGRMRLVRAGMSRFRHRTVARLKQIFAVRNLIIVAVILLVSFTAYRQLKIRSELLTRSEVERLSNAGTAALEAGDIPEADKMLSQAVAWMSRTNQPDPDWEVIRHTAEETKSASRMLLEPLDTTLSFVASDPSGRQKFIGDKGIVLDLVVTPTEEGGWGSDFVAFAKNEPVAVAFPRESLYREISFSAPTRVLVLARLDSLSRNEQGWQLSFVPHSVVMMTQPSLLSSLKISDRETQDLVKQQARILHASEEN